MRASREAEEVVGASQGVLFLGGHPTKLMAYAVEELLTWYPFVPVEKSMQVRHTALAAGLFPSIQRHAGCLMCMHVLNAMCHTSSGVCLRLQCRLSSSSHHWVYRPSTPVPCCKLTLRSGMCRSTSQATGICTIESCPTRPPCRKLGPCHRPAC